MRKKCVYVFLTIFTIIIFSDRIFAKSCIDMGENQCKSNSSQCGWLNKSCRPKASSCADFQTENECEVGINSDGDRWGCAWNDKYEFCSPTGLVYLSCGKASTKAYDIPVIIPQLTSYAIVALKTITPVILIIIGMFQLIKAISSQKEDEMQKAKSSLIKKLIAAVIIFFTVTIVQFVINKVADDAEQSSVSTCLSCFINNDCDKSYYFADGYGNCYSVKNHNLTACPTSNY